MILVYFLSQKQRLRPFSYCAPYVPKFEPSKGRSQNFLRIGRCRNLIASLEQDLVEEDALLCVVHEQGLLGLHLLDAEQDKKLAVAGQLDLKMVKGSTTCPR